VKAALVSRASVMGWVMPAASHPAGVKKSAVPPRNAEIPLGGLRRNGTLTLDFRNEDEENRTG
jgi:hypothetical protein